MMILFWCPSCRALHSPAEVDFAGDADTTATAPTAPRCRRSGQPVEFRPIPDDPDDERYGLPRCPLCRGEVRSSSRFCSHCGAPLDDPEPSVAQSAAAEHGAALFLVQFARQYRRRQQLARILTLLADQRGLRRRPQAGDLPGAYDAWFDGGAVRYLTSLTEYYFADGSRATTHDLSLNQLRVELPDGALATIEEPPIQPGFADRVLAAVLVECQRILRSAHTDDGLPGTGQPPTQCIVVEGLRDNASGPPASSWLYDLTTNMLTPHLDAPPEMSAAPVDGMYFRQALIRYDVAEDRRTLEFACTLGPRFGRGFAFDLVEEAAGVLLANGRLLWMS